MTVLIELVMPEGDVTEKSQHVMRDALLKDALGDHNL